jgi:Tol biopolymer transport system component
MRIGVILVALTAMLAAAQAPAPQRIAFARAFPNPGQLGLFIAAADGSNERLLLAAANLDYDPAWAPDGRSIIFTSERDGSADLYRVNPDGTGLERLTDHPAYDDQAAFSPIQFSDHKWNRHRQLLLFRTLSSEPAQARARS